MRRDQGFRGPSIPFAATRLSDPLSVLNNVVNLSRICVNTLGPCRVSTQALGVLFVRKGTVSIPGRRSRVFSISQEQNDLETDSAGRRPPGDLSPGGGGQRPGLSKHPLKDLCGLIYQSASAPRALP